MTEASTSLDIRIDRKHFRRVSTGESWITIKDLKLQVPAAQFLCLVGPSGCGKTTLMNIVAGLDKDVDGEVKFVDDTPMSAIRMSYMFQTPRLLPWMTVIDNVSVVMGDDLSEDDKRSRATEILTEMGLDDSLNEFPNRLSGGMQRRVALARAFVTQPQLLLLDEPFVSLDAPVGNRLRRILLDMWRARPTTVLFVTHDLREAIYLADRIVFLSTRPSRVILDIDVGQVRPRDIEDPAIDRFRLDLLERNQSLLHGLAGNGSNGISGSASSSAEQSGEFEA